MTTQQQRRPRIRARRENGQIAPILARDPASIGETLRRLAAGDSVRAIAEDLNVSHQAVRMLLLDEVPEEYRTYQRQGLIARIVEADRQLEDAATPIAIARAREMCRFSRWDAERRLPHLFGLRTHIMVDQQPDAADLLGAAGDLVLALERRRAHVIEHSEAPAVPDDPA